MGETREMRSGGLALVLWIVSGCLQSEVVLCASGRVCPARYACDDTLDRCIAPEQSVPCDGKADGDDCELGGVPGSCEGGICTPRFCGDGIRSGGEICDGTDLGGQTCATLDFYGETTGLACTPNCTFDVSGCEGACGDGMRNGSERCDGQDVGTATCIDAGFYEPAGLACSPFCTYDVALCSERCGDNIKNGPEQCDGAPPTESCIDTGLDAGTLDCNLACGYDFASCARFGWRFQNTFPMFNGFASVHGSGPSDIWLGAYDGSTYHFDGSAWTIIGSGTSASIDSMWTLGPGDAWLVDGSGTVRHWNGTNWTSVSAPAGANAVWATASNDVWLATTNNGVKRWNGSAWTDVGAVTQTGLRMISGRGPSDVWVSTNGGEALHWNGSTWTARALGVAGAYFYAMYASGADEVWLVGASYNELPFRAHWKAGWTSEEVAVNGGSSYKSLTGTGPNDLWVLNDEGIAEHYDGGAWLPVPVPMDEHVFALAPSDVIGISARSMYRFGGQAYVSLPPAPIFVNGDMFVSRTGHIFMPAQGTGNPVAHWDGLAWSSSPASGGAVMAIWGSSATDVWAAGASGKPTHFTGSTWTETTIANTLGLRSAWGSGATDVWFGGYGGVMLHYDGLNWTNRDIGGLTGSNFIGAISGSGPDDVWALAGTGQLFHWTGTWAPVTPPGGGPVASMVSIGPDQVVVIQNERAYHRSGGTWTERPLPNAEWRPFTLAASGPNDVFGLAQSNLIYHFDGDDWSLVRTPADTALHAVARLSVTARRVDLFFVGASRILRTLIRTRPWHCAATEAGACIDAVDNDCDGATDELDSDC